MIGLLSGSVQEIQGRTVIIDAGGVGYEVRCSNACVQCLSEGQGARLVVYTDVKDDAINLYGFVDRLEKQAFMLLLQVKGVGARSASDILSQIDKLDLLRAIGAGDVNALQRVRGVGRKTAERIVVELKDRVAEFALEKQSLGVQVEKSAAAAFEDAVQALVALGFARREAERAVQQAGQNGLSEELDSGRIVKEALRYV